MENTLETMEINKLLDKNYFIPHYQRGYRWGSGDATKLLDDVWEFSKGQDDVKLLPESSQKRNGESKTENGGDGASQTENGKDKFYCLQPVVVRSENGEYNVIDGQQRLTTIYLILKHLEKDKPFSIAYAREGSRAFLENIESRLGEKNNNIDYFNMVEVYEAIGKWFENKDKKFKEKYKNTFLHQVKVIWYEVDSSHDEEEIFTRLNMGKIPLTNAELIKALLLNQIKDKNEQTLYAAHLDSIEKALHNDDFWYFLTDDKSFDSPTRIDLIYNLIGKVDNKDNGRLAYDHFERELNKDFEGELNKADDKQVKAKELFKQAKAKELFGKIVEHFRILNEWYENSEYFHKIGFLIETKRGKIGDILEQYKKDNGTKDDFLEYLDGEIREYFHSKKKNKAESWENFIGNLSYESDRPVIKNLLLLFNIQTILGGDGASGVAKTRLSFEAFKKQKWDVEHITPQADSIESREPEWLEMMLKYGDETLRKIAGASKVAKIKESAEKLTRNLNRSDSEEIFNKEFIKALYSECVARESEQSGQIEGNSLENLTLLDSGTNRSYGNAFFPIKRAIIMEKDQSAAYILPCTRNVFMKYYTKEAESITKWGERDADDYLDKIREVLSKFGKNQQGGENE